MLTVNAFELSKNMYFVLLLNALHFVRQEYSLARDKVEQGEYKSYENSLILILSTLFL